MNCSAVWNPRPLMPAKETVLVTGATGFVGRRLVGALLARGTSVRAMGRNPDALALLQKLGAEPYPADLGGDPETIAEACRGANMVYHLGALSSAWGARREFEAVNVGGTRAIVDGCAKFGAGRLVHVSSPSVLFNGQDQENLRDDAPYPAHFVSVYSETKKRAEDVVNAARHTVSFVILRPKAIFGPGDTTLLPRLIRAAERNRLPRIGDGENRVDLTYVDNVVHALLLAADAPDAALGKTYTITNGETVPPLWDVIDLLLCGLNLPTPKRRIPASMAYAAASLSEAFGSLTGREPILTRYGVLILARTQTYDISPARRDLAYAPIVSLDEGIARTIAAFSTDAAKETAIKT